MDLFSGIVGFSLGLERASKSFKTIAFCEIDAFCTQILNKHWPDVPVYQDIRELTYEKLKADGVVADSVCDGFNTSEQGIVPPANDRPRQGKMLCKLADIPHRERDLEPLQDSHTI